MTGDEYTVGRPAFRITPAEIEAAEQWHAEWFRCEGGQHRFDCSSQRCACGELAAPKVTTRFTEGVLGHLAQDGML